MSPQKVWQKELCWVAQLGVKLVDQVWGWELGSAVGWPSSKAPFGDTSSDTKQVTSWMAHTSLCQEQHSLLLDKDHPPTLSHLRVGECDHTKGQTAEKKNNLRFSRYLRDTRRSLLCHHATHYRGGSSVGTVVETRVQGYRCPQIPTVSLQRALQRDQGHLKQNRGQKSCSQQKF